MVPRSGKLRWYETEFGVAVGSGVPAVLVSVPAVVAAWFTGHHSLTGLAAGAVGMNILSAAVKVLQARHKDKLVLKHESPLDLTACLHVLRAAVLCRRGILNTEANRSKLRVTIHEVSDDSDTVEQIVPYVGEPSDPATNVGRRHSKRSGAVGRAINTRECAVMHRKHESHDDYADEVCREWAMPREEAEQLARDRWSFLAVPLVDKQGSGRVTGVVYFDSSEKDFFNARVRAFTEHACVGVAEYVKARYAKS